MSLIAYSISGNVNGTITGVQALKGYMWFQDNPELHVFDPNPATLEYHVIYKTYYVFIVNGYFTFTGADNMVLHLPGAGLFDDQQSFGGVCCKGYLAPVDIDENIRNVEPLTAVFYDESDNPYPPSTAENHNNYLVPPHKVVISHLAFNKPTGASHFAVGSNIELTRVENAGGILPPP